MIGIGRRLRLWREENRLSQRQMADILGIERNTYQNYEAEKFSPSLDRIVPLAEHGINFDWLLTGRGDMRAYENVLSKTREFDTNSALLEAAIAAVEEWLEKRRRTLSPSDKARAVRLVMAQAAERGGDVDAMGVDGIVRVIAYAG